MVIPKQTLRENVLSAIGYSLCLQPILLFTFLLFSNFHALHPILWITSTVWNMCTFGTWISMIPLLVVVTAYNISMYTRLMEEKRYYGSRFCRLTLPFMPKFAFINTQILLSLSATWFYMCFLPLDYRVMIVDCYENQCLNGRFMYLLFIGFAAGLYHYALNFATADPALEFPLVQQRRLVQLRYWLTITLKNSLKQAIVPTFVASLVYAAGNYRFNRIFANTLNINLDDMTTSLCSVFTDFGLLFYAWLLTTLIFSNLQLIYRFYSIAIGDHVNFPISAVAAVDSMQPQELILVQALGLDKQPVLQKLAALQLHQIANEVQRQPERSEVFALTRLSDHPYNWHHLSTQCLILINSFTEQLNTAIKKVSVVSAPLMNNNLQFMRPLPSEIAQQMLLRQFNEPIGLRRMVADTNVPPITLKQPTLFQGNFPTLFEKTVHNLIFKLPAVKYLFGESELAHTAHMLSNSQYMVWLVQGLAGLCAVSIVEDTYGVVQNSLPDVFSALLKLKFELDKLQNINLQEKQLERQLNGLKQAVKRSIYRMCTAFADYLEDIIRDGEELQKLKCYLSYQE